MRKISSIIVIITTALSSSVAFSADMSEATLRELRAEQGAPVSCAKLANKPQTKANIAIRKRHGCKTTNTPTQPSTGGGSNGSNGNGGNNGGTDTGGGTTGGSNGNGGNNGGTDTGDSGTGGTNGNNGNGGNNGGQ